MEVLIKNTSTDKLMATHNNARIFFEQLNGNNGDKLIRMGAYEGFRRAGLTLVETPEEAEIIYINGGFAFSDVWPGGLVKLRHYAQHYVTKPLVILPASFFFRQTNFPELFHNRSAPTIIYARERYSLDVIQKLRFPAEVQVGLDHDMAFRLSESEYLKELRAKSAQKHILIVERFDNETATGIFDKPMRVPAKRLIPHSFKAPVKRWMLRRRWEKTEFYHSAVRRVIADNPKLADASIFAGDVSRTDSFSFDEFGLAVAESAAVVTTRLHVAILASMLGKSTYIKLPSGPVKKIQGIYEYSLSALPHVQIF
jgi:exopolysaccharide biosynthesis predicted pyruvyltransferase EpsI